MAITIEDITTYTGSEYGVYRFKAKATDEKDKVYADSDYSNVVEYNIPLLSLALDGKVVTITGFIDGVTSVDVYLNGAKVSTITRTTEESLTYTIGDDVDKNAPNKIYAVANGTGIRENRSDTIVYGASPTFADNDWATISAISSQIATLSLTGDLLYNYIKQEYGWSVGDTKTYTNLSGDTYTLQIWDFNAEVDENGNKVGVQMGSVELQKTTQQMNSTGTNAGGYGASKMALTTLPSIKETLPDDLKGVLKTIKKTYHSGSDDPNTERTMTCDLYLPSEYNVFGSTSYALQEGVHYKYWQEHNTSADRVKHLLGSTSGHYWWLSSAYRYNPSYFAGVGSDGYLYYGNANTSAGVCLCLSI